jgi:cytochrome oxidase assembly protein ShyY1
MAANTMTISVLSSIKASKRSRRYIVWLLFWSVLVVLGIGLGIWQWDRADDKRKLLARKDAAPVLVHPRHTRIDGAKVTLEGHYLASHTLFLDNRTLNGRLGVAVLTPFKDIHGKLWLIQRGFIETGVSRSQPNAETPGALVSVEGEWQTAGYQGPIYGLNREGMRLQQLNTDAWIDTLGELDHSGWLHAEQGAGVFARWWKPSSIPPTRHIGYAFQWWGLSLAACVVMWIGGRQLLCDSLKTSKESQ